MKSYPLGEQINFATSFFDTTTGVLTSPTTVTLTLVSPTGVSTPVTVTSPKTGQFVGSYTPLQSGIWSYRWLGVGSVQAANEGKFEIQPSIFVSGA